MNKTGSKLKFDAATHQYTVAGRKAISVTMVLSHCGAVNAAFVGGPEFLERGTVIHEHTAKMDAGDRAKLTDIPKKWRGFVKAWQKFRDETGFKPVLIEHAVHCPDPLYAGTLDRLGHFSTADKIPTILDIKNTSAKYVAKWVKYQLVGYGYALNPRKLYHRVGVALHEDGSYGVTRFGVETYMNDLARFLTWTKAAIDGDKFMRTFVHRPIGRKP